MSTEIQLSNILACLAVVVLTAIFTILVLCDRTVQ